MHSLITKRVMSPLSAYIMLLFIAARRYYSFSTTDAALLDSASADVFDGETSIRRLHVLNEFSVATADGAALGHFDADSMRAFHTLSASADGRPASALPHVDGADESDRPFRSSAAVPRRNSA